MGETKGKVSVASRVYVPESEKGYTAWMKQNPRGYVVNAPKAAITAKPMMWHRADCGHIQPDGKSRFVEDNDLKACSLDPGALAVWAFSYGRALDYCDTCRTKWENDQRKA
jgi:hypothetical protein